MTTLRFLPTLSETHVPSETGDIKTPLDNKHPPSRHQRGELKKRNYYPTPSPETRGLTAHNPTREKIHPINHD